MQQIDIAKIITAKLKNLRRVLNAWRSNISSLVDSISNIKPLIEFLDLLEEHMDLLALHEWNFRGSLNQLLVSLLKQQKSYRKQRGTFKYVKYGDGNTKFFYPNATIKSRKNAITSLTDSNGNQYF